MKRRAFTLIEILVVVAILAILMAILLPVLSRVREMGRRTACASNLHQLGLAVRLYATDWDRFPRGLDPADKYSPQIWTGYPAVQAFLAVTPLLPEVMQPYIKSADVWKCPSDTGFDEADTTGTFLNSVPTRPSCAGMYGMSYFYRTNLTWNNYAEEDLSHPTEINVLCDASGAWHGNGENDWKGRRYNVLFGDSHVKNVNRDQMDAAWDMPER